MSNSAIYHNTYRDTYNAVKYARDEYMKRLQFLERYKGSEGYDEDVKQAQEEFDAQLATIRSEAQAGFSKALDGMEAKTAQSDAMDVPTEEQVRLLQALDLRDKIEPSELQRAARTCRGSETALRTLEGMARKKGAWPEGSGGMRFRSTADQARGVLGTLKNAADSLMHWDGRDHQELMKERMAARHGALYGWADGEKRVEEKDLPPIGTAFVEETKAGLTPRHTLEAIVGHDSEGNLNCSPDALAFLD